MGSACSVSMDLMIALCPSNLMHPVAKFLKTTRNSKANRRLIPHYSNTDYTNRVFRKQLFDALKQEYIYKLHGIHYHSFIFDECTQLWSLSPSPVSLPRDICNVIMSYFDTAQLMDIHCKRLFHKQFKFKPHIPVILGWIEFIGFCYCTLFHFIHYDLYQSWLCSILLCISSFHLCIIAIQCMISYYTLTHLQAIRRIFFVRYIPMRISSDLWEAHIAIQRYCNVRSLFKPLNKISTVWCIAKYVFYILLFIAYDYVEYLMRMVLIHVALQCLFRTSITSFTKICNYWTIFYIPHVYGCDCAIPYFIFYVMCFGLFGSNSYVITWCENVDTMCSVSYLIAWIVFALIMDHIRVYCNVHLYQVKLKYMVYVHKMCAQRRRLRQYIQLTLDKYVLTIHLLCIAMIPKVIMLGFILVVVSWRYRNVLFIAYCNRISSRSPAKPNDVPLFYIYDDKYCDEFITSTDSIHNMNHKHFRNRFAESERICRDWDDANVLFVRQRSQYNEAFTRLRLRTRRKQKKENYLKYNAKPQTKRNHVEQYNAGKLRRRNKSSFSSNRFKTNCR